MSNDEPPDTTARPKREGRLLGRLLRRLRSQPTGAEQASSASQSNLERMVKAVIDLDKKQIRDIMVPRSEVVFAYEDETIDKVLERVVESGFTRLPVADKDEQKILGILHAKDLLQVQKPGAQGSPPLGIRALMRPMQTVPESMRVAALLEDFKRKRLHMASVVDEYGGIAGLVTIEDIIEEIVGDIEDEHDKKDAVPKIVNRAHNTWDVKGYTPLSEFNSFFDAELQSNGADTLGGLVAAKLGRIPERGQSLHLGPFYVRVLEVERGRMELLRVRKVEEQREAS